MNDLEKSIYEKCLELSVIPSKKNIKEISGIPYSSLLRVGFKLSLITKAIEDHFPNESNNTSCQFCGDTFDKKYKEQKYCSHSCSASSTNTLRARAVQNKCLNCGTDCKSKFCNSDCGTKYKTAVKMSVWLSGDDNSASNTRIRKYLTILHGYKCSCCGISDWNSENITLEVEHINGDSSNSSPGNVCLLCPNCHSQTPTYRAKNKGNGRHSRRVRYKEGKSY